MTIPEAIKALEKQGWKIYTGRNLQEYVQSCRDCHYQLEKRIKQKRKEAFGKKLFLVYGKYWSTIATGRELIKMAKNKRSKRDLKQFNNSKNRSSTRQAIKTENFDAIPLNDSPKEEDAWGWD